MQTSDLDKGQAVQQNHLIFLDPALFSLIRTKGGQGLIPLNRLLAYTHHIHLIYSCMYWKL